MFCRRVHNEERKVGIIIYHVTEAVRRREVFCKSQVLKNFAKFTGKHLCQSLFFNKVVGLKPATLLKMRLWHRCFSVNFKNFYEHVFLKNTSGGYSSACKYYLPQNSFNPYQSYKTFIIETSQLIGTAT